MMWKWLRELAESQSPVTPVLLHLQAEHRPKVTVHNDPFGGVTIKLDDFNFVKIEYDPRYTDNAHQKRLVDHVLGFFEQGRER